MPVGGRGATRPVPAPQPSGSLHGVRGEAAGASGDRVTAQGPGRGEAASWSAFRPGTRALTGVCPDAPLGGPRRAVDIQWLGGRKVGGAWSGGRVGAAALSRRPSLSFAVGSVCAFHSGAACIVLTGHASREERRLAACPPIRAREACPGLMGRTAGVLALQGRLCCPRPAPGRLRLRGARTVAALVLSLPVGFRL